MNRGESSPSQSTRVGKSESVPLTEIASFLDACLDVARIPDYPGAFNGVQVENSGTVRRVAAAVDASQASIEEAARRGCDLLIVHHGLFWDAAAAVTGRRYRRIRALFDADMAVYSAHLPLDLHPEIGNNVLLARELGVEIDAAFGDFKGVPLGVAGTLHLSRNQLAAELERVLGGPVHLIAGGPEQIRRVGVITGGAGSHVAAAAAAGLDAFITGEGAHHTHFDAMEGAVNVYFGGHYATETFGVRALAALLESRYGLEWEMLHQPTGL